MLWVNWIPEMVVLSLLLAALLFLSVRNVGSRVALMVGGGFSVTSLFYFWFREASFSYESPYYVFILDAVSYFGRSSGLLWLGVASVYLAFHEEISLKTKFRIGTLFIFFAGFFDTLFLAKPILMFLVSWLGGTFALTFMMVSESEQSGLRSALSKQVSIQMILVSVFAAILNFFPESSEAIVLLGCLVTGAFPLNILQIRNYSVRAPLSLSWWNLWNYFAGGVFWLRFGGPIFASTPEVPGIIFCVTAFASAVVAVRTVQPLNWLGAILSSVGSLSLLALILDPDRGINLFYNFGLLFIFIFTFAGFAFHRKAPLLKKSKMLVALSLVVFFFPLIEELIVKGFLIFAVAGTLIWFLLSASVIQQLGNLITTKNSQEVDSLPNRVLFFVFLISVIALTALKVPLLQLLNHHPS